MIWILDSLFLFSLNGSLWLQFSMQKCFFHGAETPLSHAWNGRSFLGKSQRPHLLLRGPRQIIGFNGRRKQKRKRGRPIHYCEFRTASFRLLYLLFLMCLGVLECLKNKYLYVIRGIYTGSIHIIFSRDHFDDFIPQNDPVRTIIRFLIIWIYLP